MSLPDLVGLVGAVFYLGAYGLLQLGMLSLRDWRYAGLNVLGAVALIVLTVAGWLK